MWAPSALRNCFRVRHKSRIPFCFEVRLPSHKAKTRTPFAADYARIARRRGKNIATVAVARKLLTRCLYILRDLGRSEGSATR